MLTLPLDLLPFVTLRGFEQQVNTALIHLIGRVINAAAGTQLD